MKTFGLVALGVAIGLVASKYLMNPGTCCDRVAAGVRDRVEEKLGGTAAAIGDALGVWEHTPGLLDMFGVDK
jgi:hypothetical protein